MVVPPSLRCIIEILSENLQIVSNTGDWGSPSPRFLYNHPPIEPSLEPYKEPPSLSTYLVNMDTTVTGIDSWNRWRMGVQIQFLWISMKTLNWHGKMSWWNFIYMIVILYIDFLRRKSFRNSDRNRIVFSPQVNDITIYFSYQNFVFNKLQYLNLYFYMPMTL